MTGGGIAPYRRDEACCCPPTSTLTGGPGPPQALHGHYGQCAQGGIVERQVNNWRALNRLEKAAWAPTLFAAFSAWFCVTEFNYASHHNSDLAIVLGWLGAALVALGIAVAVIASTAAGLLRAGQHRQRPKHLHRRGPPPPDGACANCATCPGNTCS